MHRWLLSLLLAVCSAGLGHADAGDVSPWVAWLEASGEVRWRTELTAPAGAHAGAALTVEPWFEVMPEVAWHDLDGAPVALFEPATRVMVLDFWASWCKPCLEELPHLESLHRALGSQGVRVLAVNVEEPPDTARSAAHALGLTMPVVRLPEGLGRSVDLGSLPAIVLLDRRGRVRASWNGYRPGLEVEVAERARELAASNGAVEVTSIATLEVGAGSAGISWRQTLDGNVDGVAAAPYVDQSPRVIALAGEQLAAFGPDGRLLGRVRAAPGMGRLHVADVTGDGVDDLIGWRPGARRVGIVDMRLRRGLSWDSRLPVRSLSVAPGSGGERVAVATSAEVELYDAEGRVVATLAGESRAVAGGATDLAVLGPQDTLRIVSPDGSEARALPAPSGAEVVARSPDGSGFLIGSTGVEQLAFVRWADDGKQVAASTSDGHVAVLDAADGRIRLLARWLAPVGQLAAFDRFQEGRDDLAVAAGEAVTVIGWTPSVDAPRAPEVPSRADGAQ